MTGDKRYDLANHLGNVLVVVDDKLIPGLDSGHVVSHFNADVLSYNDYDPFGMLVPNRHATFGNYRYGFQGQEKDDELKGEGNSLNYTYRMHDPRVGRFFAMDPLTSKYPFYSPYQFAGNKVIMFNELEGLEEGMKLPGGLDFKYLATDKSVEGQILRGTLNQVREWGTVTYWKNLATNLAVQTWKWNGGDGFEGQLEASQDIINSSQYISNIIREKDYEKMSQLVVEFVGTSIILERVFKSPFMKKSSMIASDAAYAYAKEVILERSKRQLPRSISVVYDRVTKKYYYGESQGLKIDDLTPELKKALPKESKEAWSVLNCSEANALNNAFLDGAKSKNLDIHTIKIEKKTGLIEDFPPCENCKVTTKKINNTTGSTNTGG